MSAALLRGDSKSITRQETGRGQGHASEWVFLSLCVTSKGTP